MSKSRTTDSQHGIAVIGMSGRFPGARDLTEFWENLKNGVESISFFSDEVLLAEGVDEDALRDHRYVKAGGVLEDTDLFDAGFFGFTPRQAEFVDPQHRLFLECAHHALENAAYDYERYSGRIGVYAGCGINTYFLSNILAGGHAGESTIGTQALVQSSDKDYLSTRVSYKLNLKGPSLTVQTACSTSLVAVHLACQSLFNFECDIALAGGVSAAAAQRTGYFYQDGGILSPDGHCRAFDENARGTVPGNGAGIVVLKRLDEALEAGDRIRAIIRGSAINNDGSLKIGFTAPSVQGQADVIVEAQAVAGVDPHSIGYIEAHGTGTTLGDPIEIAALNEAFGPVQPGSCAIGSLKTNIGHLDAAAGVAGLIKTVLALENGVIPPSLNFDVANSAIAFENTPFYVAAELSEWKSNGSPRRAGVSSFGIGGTNAHVVVEEAPPPSQPAPGRPWQLLTLSAKSEAALDDLTNNLAADLRRGGEVDLADVAFTLGVGRRSFAHRRALVCRDREHAINLLEALHGDSVHTARVESRSWSPVFMFPGQGSQRTSMALDLYENEPIFAEQVDRACRILLPHIGFDLRHILFPSDIERSAADLKINQTFITQPALFVVEYSLARLMMELGVVPQAMIGHSIGEYVAACLADVFSLEDALTLVAARGKLIQGLPSGAMLSAALSESQARFYLSERVSLAAVNSPTRSVLSGPLEDIEQIELKLSAAGVESRRLHTSHAFHSSMMEPILGDFRKLVGGVNLKPPRIPFVSNVTGTWIAPDQATDADYWTRHLRNTVRFGDGATELLKSKDKVFVEIGPGRILSGLVSQQARVPGEFTCIQTLSSQTDSNPDQACFMKAVGRVWLTGIDIRWDRFYEAERRRRVPLTGYPFQRSRYWLSRPTSSNLLTVSSVEDHGAHDLEGPGAIQSPKGVEASMDVNQVETKTPELPDASPSHPGRRQRIVSELQSLINTLTGFDIASIDTQASFLELGADSLLLVQFTQMMQERFSVKVPFRRLFDDLGSLDMVAGHLDLELPPEEFAEVEMVTSSLSVNLADQSANGDHSPIEAPVVHNYQAVSPSPAPIEPRSSTTAVRVPETVAMVATQSAITQNRGPMESILSQQLQIMSQLFSEQMGVLRDALSGGSATLSAAPQIAAIQPSENQAPAGTIVRPGSAAVELLPTNSSAQAGSKSAVRDSATIESAEHVLPRPGEGAVPFVPYKPPEVTPATGLTREQTDYLNEFIGEYSARTKGSKQLAETGRPLLSDSFASSGFRLALKELIYPIYSGRTTGSRMWDVDGNEFVDTAMGYGVHLFGNNPGFIDHAIKRRIDEGWGLAPQRELTNDVARLISEMTGVERVSFCNSGTDSVVAAIRIARTVTRRTKIALFAGSYHGWSDVTLVRGFGTGTQGRTLPGAPGVPASVANDVIVLEYGNPASLEKIKAHAHELAAVLVEPVQSRMPGLQPREFLLELRALTDSSGALLIFDEMITGFRLHQAGAQAFFGIDADLVTYGKIVGGGMPIGVIAGRREYMDAIDGGAWSFGDPSYPESEQTFFAGTFFKHPLTMAAAHAVLQHLKSMGPSLQDDLNRRTSEMVQTIRTYFDSNEVPIKIANCGSLFRFFPDAHLQLPDLFFHHLIHNGVFNWKGGNYFLSTAHTEQDIERIVEAVVTSIEQLRRGTFLPESAVTRPTNGARKSAMAAAAGSQKLSAAAGQILSGSDNGHYGAAHGALTSEADTVPVETRPNPQDRAPSRIPMPLTELQRQVWTLMQMGGQYAQGMTTSFAIRLRGPFNISALRRAAQTVFDRHEALRLTVSPDGGVQVVNPSFKVEVPLVDFSHLSEAEGVRAVDLWLKSDATEPFDLQRGPLCRIRVAKLNDEYHTVCVTTNHFATDGRSNGIIQAELAALYSAESEGRTVSLPPALSFTEYVQRAVSEKEAYGERDEAYWIETFKDGLPVLELPTDRPRSNVSRYRSGQYFGSIGSRIRSGLEKLSASHGCSLFMTTLAGFKLLMSELSGQEDIVVGINVLQQQWTAGGHLVAFLVNPLAVRSRINADQNLAEYIRGVRDGVFDAHDHQNVTFGSLNRKVRINRDPNRSNLNPGVAFNLDRGGEPAFAGLQAETLSNPFGSSKLDIYLDISDKNGELSLGCYYNADLFDEETIKRWLGRYERILEGFVANAERPIRALTAPPELAGPPSPSLDDSLDLTKYQLFIWAGQRLHPDTALFINAGYTIVPAAIDQHCYKEAIRTLIDKCDALRTVIVDEGGVPRQRVLPELPYDPEFVDLSAAENPREELDLWARRRCQTVLDIQTCVFDAALIKLSEAEYAMYLNIHHLVTDAWSAALLIAQFEKYYQLALLGRLHEAETPPQFRDYVRQELEQVESPRAAAAEAYWKQKLAEESEPLKFYGRAPLIRTTKVQRVSCEIDSERTRKLKELAHRRDVFVMSEDVSLHHVFAAVVSTYLHHVTGSRKIALGSPFHNRRSQRETVGLIMRILPLKVEIEDADTFLSIVSRIANEHFKMMRYQDYQIGNSFQKRLYDVEFNYIYSNGTNEFDLNEFNGFPVEHTWLHPGHGTDSLAIQMYDNLRGGLTCEFDFHCDVFDERQRALALGHFLQVVDAVIADAGQLIERVNLVSADEEEQILRAFNNTDQFVEDTTFVALFEERVRTSPDRVAVTDSVGCLTYEELNLRANNLCNRLASLGIGPECVVALLSPRNMDFLTAVIGILKAGAAYLPLDPDYPESRISQLLTLSRSKAIAVASNCQSKLSAVLETGAASELPLVVLEEMLGSRVAVGNDPAPGSIGRNISYVIYTSGSTGTPKGAMIENSGMLNHLLVKVTSLDLTAADVVAQSASQCSDVSVWQLLSGLLVGGVTHIVDDDTVRDPLEQLRQVERERLTILELVPSQLRGMLEAMTILEDVRPDLGSLKMLIVNGEALPPEVAAKWFEYYPGIPLMNAYGPTECSDDVSQYVISAAPSRDDVRVPIGRPVANTRLYVMNSHLVSAPVGVVGELYIGGAGVGRGYLDDPERTAQSFLPDSCSDRAGSRFYKSGDLARIQSDGNVDFIGRVDHQLKIRGFRVELPEIERALELHPSILQAVVVAREDSPGDKRLVAYVQPQIGADPGTQELRGFLRERLPAYMMPSAFVLIESMPLHPSGKVNRKALPSPGVATVEDDEFVAPRTETERTLAGIWAQVLGAARVGVKNNFFELGGDSILMVLVAAKANQAGIRLKPTLIFEHQTIAELAEAVSSSPAVEAEQGEVTGPVPLTPVQHWFFEEVVADTSHYNHAVILALREHVDASLMERAVRNLFKHHDALRLRFEMKDGDWLQFNAPVDDSLPFSVDDLSVLAEAEQTVAIEVRAEQLQRSLDLSQGPIARFALFQLGPNKPPRLLVIVHHLAIDGISWRILLEDLQSTYEQLKQGQEASLPLKSTSFKQWAERLAEYSRSEAAQDEAGYWLSIISSPSARLPVDLAGGKNTRESARSVIAELAEDETRNLLHGFSDSKLNIKDVLLTALAATLSEWTGARSHIIKLEGHGREELFQDLDTSRTVGWFTSMFPVVLDAAPESSRIELLNSTARQMRRVPQNGIGYGVLRYLTREITESHLREGSRPELEFNYMGQLDQAVSEDSLFRVANESTGSSAGSDGSRACLISVEAMVISGRLRMGWIYSRNIHSAETIQRVADRYLHHLKLHIAGDRRSEGADGFADYEDFNWSKEELDEILAVVEDQSE